MTINTHFDASVSPTVANKLHAVALLVQHNYISDYKQPNGSYGDSNLTTIGGKPEDGYVPFQQGGFEVTDFYQCDQDTSYHLTSKQSEYMAKLDKACLEQFCEENDIVNVNDIPDGMSDILSDFEANWYEPTLLRFRIYIKHNLVCMRLSVNYKDMPYYRNDSDELISEHTLSIDDFMTADNNELIKEVFVND